VIPNNSLINIRSVISGNGLIKILIVSILYEANPRKLSDPKVNLKAVINNTNNNNGEIVPVLN
jgi:hypothetical protein